MGKPKVKFDNKDEIDDAKISQLGNKKRFHPNDLVALTPRNPRQEQFFHDYYTQIPMIIQRGAAGTGKTTLAMYAAFTEVFDQSTPFDKLIIIRSPVATRDIGFLPGTEEDKAAPFEEAYVDVAQDIIRYNKPYNNLKALGYLQFRLSNNLRGLTFNDCVILIDEVQNLEQHELLTILTRGGRNCKIILCGDSKQDDLRGKKGQVSCFKYLENLTDIMSEEFTSTITYSIDDCQRNAFVKEVLRADAEL